MSKLYSGAEIVFKCLEDQGVEFIFGYPGGAVLPIYDELKNHESIKHILVRHEQGAGHAAEGYARSSNKPGVVLVTSGPGATNAVTALTDAYMDSVPLVCISGQVPTHLIGTDAFQECDTTGITRPCTKHNWLVKDVKNLSKVIHKAFEVATTGRPGPVLVDIPKDIQFQKTNYLKYKKQKKLNGKIHNQFTQKNIDELIKLMSKASKPIFYTGGGVINSGPKASELLRELVSLTGFPITSTLQGLGSIPGNDNQFLGMLGMHGSYEANNAMYHCDLMINIGARFDDRITGKIDEFSPKSKKVHIDIDPSSINKNVKVDLPIVGDVADVIRAGRTHTHNLQSSTHGYIGGFARFDPADTANENRIEKYSFAAGTNSTDVGNLTRTGDWVTSVSQTTYGYCMGSAWGATPYTNIIDRFSFTSDGNATDVGDLTVTRGGGAGSYF